MIIDCFTFFNEFDILDIRFNEMYDVVDKFVIVESNETHSRNPKEYLFTKNRYRYDKKFLEKVISVQITFPELGDNRWSYENYQRNQIMKGLITCNPDDIIIISDVDEIPRHEFFAPARIAGIRATLKSTCDHILLTQSPRYYYFNYQQTGYHWFGPVVTLYSKLTEQKPPQWYRDNRSKTPVVYNWQGWHLSYMADIKDIRVKLQSFAHAEYSGDEYTNDEKLKRCLSKGVMHTDENIKLDLIPVDDCTLPEYVKKNLEKFDRYIKKK